MATLMSAIVIAFVILLLCLVVFAITAPFCQDKPYPKGPPVKL